jgi:hypothetical protein
MLPNDPFSDGLPFFSFLFIPPLILGENHRKQKFCQVIYMGYQPHRGELFPVSLGCHLGGPYFGIPQAFIHLHKMSLSKKSKKVFSRPIFTWKIA